MENDETMIPDKDVSVLKHLKELMKISLEKSLPLKVNLNGCWNIDLKALDCFLKSQCLHGVSI